MPVVAEYEQAAGVSDPAISASAAEDA